MMHNDCSKLNIEKYFSGRKENGYLKKTTDIQSNCCISEITFSNCINHVLNGNEFSIFQELLIDERERLFEGRQRFIVSCGLMRSHVPQKKKTPNKL